ncbi:hypothetical protein, partial [Mycoplasmopsis bovis]|uniref:hypothetical protein n=1 Tax=Mycoplasmopsis bovis TaxID=28903 RepID=UPI003D2CFAC3
ELKNDLKKLQNNFTTSPYQELLRETKAIYFKYFTLLMELNCAMILINFQYLSLLKPNNFASTIFMFNVKFTYEYFRKWTRTVSLYYIWRN